MELNIKGQNIDLGEALRAYVEKTVEPTVEKHFGRAIKANVVFSREKSKRLRAVISVHAKRGILVQGHGAADDPQAAFDSAMERIEKQLRRYKSRLIKHKKGRGTDEGIFTAHKYIIAPEPAEEEALPEAADAAIIAEMPTAIDTLTVSEAVMRMDLADVAAMMFRNSAHGELNVVYRRADGNIGWIDPSDTIKG
jgi:ribosomal subunit interface protein